MKTAGAYLDKLHVAAGQRRLRSGSVAVVVVARVRAAPGQTQPKAFHSSCAQCLLVFVSA